MTVEYIRRNKKITYTSVTYKHRSRGSKFASNTHFFSIARLAFTLTLKTHPFKFSSQMIAVAAGAVFTTGMLTTALRGGIFIAIVFFAVLYIIFFLIFLSYIYTRGSMVGR